MSELYILESQDRRYDEAGLWIARLEKGLSEEEKKALQHWMAADQENEALFLKMAEIWDRMDTLSRLSGLFPRQAEQRRRPARVFLAMAASILVAVLVGVWGITSTLPEMLRGLGGADVAAVGVYETSIGEHSVAKLPDGSELVLNTNSLVWVNYTDQRRLLVLERGEIHVKVAHDKSRPLSVFAGDKEIRAVGTEFSLEIHSDQMVELVVTEGNVLVGVHQRVEKDESKLISTDLPATTTAVSEGETIILGSPGEEIAKISPEEIAVKLSWREGNLIFRGESLAEAVDEIGRYTSVEFVILDENLKKLRISGLFKSGDVEGLLATLRKNFNISHTRQGKETVILSGD